VALHANLIHWKFEHNTLAGSVEGGERVEVDTATVRYGMISAMPGMTSNEVFVSYATEDRLYGTPK
jgi:hypothetical protein